MIMLWHWCGTGVVLVCYLMRKKVLKHFLSKRRNRRVRQSVEHIVVPLEVHFKNRPKTTDFDQGAR